MGFLKSLTKAVVAVASTPASVVADVATLGGVLTDRREPYTSETLRKAKANLDDAIEPERSPRRR